MVQLQSYKIPPEDSKNLAIKIRDEIFKPAYNYKTTIFLCGADLSDKNKLRFQIAEALNSWWYKYYYDIVFPEDIFDELLFSSQKRDLLSLENLLAESVDAIVIIPESPGSYSELGAFANDEKLRKKLICLIDKKYKKRKSFINQGPLKLVREENKQNLIFIEPNDIVQIVSKLNSSLKKIKKISNKTTDTITLLQIDNFLLPSIFLLEPISKESLITLVKDATNDEDNAFQSTTIALTILTKKKQVELTPDGYRLTSLGKKEFLSFRNKSARIKTQNETTAIDNLRLEILTVQNRGKKLKVKG